MMNLEPGTFSIFPCHVANGMNPYEQTVLAWLWKHKNNEGSCWPSQATLAKSCGMSRKKINEVVQSLESKGVVKTDRRRDSNGGETSLLYTIILQPPCNPQLHPPVTNGDTPPVTDGYTNYNNIRTISKEGIDMKKSFDASPYVQAWTSTFGGKPPYSRVVKVFKALESENTRVALVRAFIAYCAATDPRFASVERFAQTLGHWLKDVPKPAQRTYVDASPPSVEGSTGANLLKMQQNSSGFYPNNQQEGV